MTTIGTLVRLESGTFMLGVQWCVGTNWEHSPFTRDNGFFINTLTNPPRPTGFLLAYELEKHI